MYIHLLCFDKAAVDRYVQTHNRNGITSVELLFHMESAQLLPNMIAFTFIGANFDVVFLKEEYAKRAYEKFKEAVKEDLSYFECDVRILQLGQ